MLASDSNQLRSPVGATDESMNSEILAAARGLRFGSIVVTIHDSKVVQIEKIEKVRLQKKTGGETR